MTWHVVSGKSGLDIACSIVNNNRNLIHADVNVPRNRARKTVASEMINTLLQGKQYGISTYEKPRDNDTVKIEKFCCGFRATDSEDENREPEGNFEHSFFIGQKRKCQHPAVELYPIIGQFCALLEQCQQLIVSRLCAARLATSLRLGVRPPANRRNFSSNTQKSA